MHIYTKKYLTFVFIRTHVPGIKAAELEDLADQIADEIKDIK